MVVLYSKINTIKYLGELDASKIGNSITIDLTGIKIIYAQYIIANVESSWQVMIVPYVTQYTNFYISEDEKWSSLLVKNISIGQPVINNFYTNEVAWQNAKRVVHFFGQ